jgi:hypothetical protein
MNLWTCVPVQLVHDFFLLKACSWFLAHVFSHGLVYTTGGPPDFIVVLLIICYHWNLIRLFRIVLTETYDLRESYQCAIFINTVWKEHRSSTGVGRNFTTTSLNQFEFVARNFHGSLTHWWTLFLLHLAWCSMNKIQKSYSALGLLPPLCFLQQTAMLYKLGLFQNYICLHLVV